MPILQTIVDLFRAGANAIAEQFIRGNSKSPSLRNLLERKFGANLQVAEPTIQQFQGIVTDASIPANVTARGLLPVPESIPTWVDPSKPAGYIYTGLVNVSAVNQGGSKLASTWLPFTLEEIEIIHLTNIREQIQSAIEGGAGASEDFYQADIERIEQLIRYFEIIGNRAEINPELYGVYRSGGLG